MDVQILDVELFSGGNYGGSSLTLARNGGSNIEDIFSAKSGGSLTVLSEGTYFAVDSVSIGRVSTNCGGVLTLEFNASATHVLVNKAMQQIAYQNTSNAPPATVQIDWTFNDGNIGEQGEGGALSVVGSTMVSITSVNDAPRLIISLADQAAIVNAGFNYTIPGTSFSDPDGDTLTYSINMVDGTGVPPWLNFNAATCVLSGTPTGFDTGSIDIRVTVRDASSATASDVFRLSVDFLPLSIVTTSPLNSGTQKTAYSTNLTGIGGAVPHSWSIASGALPQGITLDGTTGAIAGTPASCGAFPITARLTDSAAVPNSVDKSLALDIACSNDYVISGNAGVAGATVAYSGTASGTVTADGSGNFSIGPLLNGTYVVTPSNLLYVFAPASRTITVNNLDISLATFTAELDSAAPTVTGFTIPATGTTQVVAISTLTATDNAAVTGYMITEYSAEPTTAATGWSATKPTSYTFAGIPDGIATAKTLYAWAKDAAGNISVPLSASVTITLPDVVAPTIIAFNIPPTSNSLTVPVSTLTATDDVAVTGYMLTETASQPQADNPSWTVAAPNTYTFASQGVKTLYVFVKDTAGNISVPLSASVTIMLPDTNAPIVTAFILPTTSDSLTVSITTLTTTDDVAATGYLLTETASQPQVDHPAWSESVPAAYTFATEGVKTLYVFAKDAAGNISVPLSAAVTITLPDTIAPTIDAFTLPATAADLIVPVSELTATDDVDVTSYLLSESANQPQSNNSAWSETEPMSYPFATQGAKTLYAFARDAAGNVSAPASATVTITLPDVAAPTVTAFTLPATATSLTVPVTALTATDSVGVTGYLLTEASEIPSVTDSHWTTTPTSSFTFANAGAKTLNAWAKDAAGNISAGLSATVTITLPDTTAPAVNLFTMPMAASSLTLAVTALSATDDVAVTGYLLSESATPPQPDNPAWTSTPPTSYTLAAQGSRTIYAFAKDAAGNVSVPQSANVTVTLPDTAAPTVTAFALPASTTSLTVPVLVFTASDNVAVTGYVLSESALTPLAADPAWRSTPPGSYTFSTEGSKTLYGFVKDAAGNISSSAMAGTTITLPILTDTTVPTVTAFTLPATSTSLTVAISNFIASDNVGVTGYCLATTDSSSACTWNATAPSSYSLTTAGSKTLYAFAKDAVGNVSNSVNASTTITLPTVGVGDIDNDGVTTSADAMFALQMAIGKKSLDLLKADVAPLVNGVPTPDGKVTAADALVILRKAVGLW